jgi:DDE superfamily endonuclease
MEAGKPAKGKQGGAHNVCIPKPQQDLLFKVVVALREASVPLHYRTVKRQVLAIMKKAGLPLKEGQPSVSWCRMFLSKNNFRRRRKTNAGRKQLPADAESIQERFFLQCALIIQEHRIPKQFVFNWDETGVSLVDLGKYTMELKGSKEVRIVGADDKRQITVATCTTAAGTCGPFTVIWQGKSSSTRAIPQAKYPQSWCVQQTESHWMTQGAQKKYLKKLELWLKSEREKLGNVDQVACMLIDTYEVHLMPFLKEWAREQKVIVKYIIPGMTGYLQPQDLAINQPFKQHVSDEMTQHFEQLLSKFLEEKNKDEDRQTQGSQVDNVVLFEKSLQKSKIGPACMNAVVKAYEWLCSDDASAKKAHSEAFKLFEKCFEKDYQQQAKEAEQKGELKRETDNTRAEDVLDVLTSAAEERAREKMATKSKFKTKTKNSKVGKDKEEQEEQDMDNDDCDHDNLYDFEDGADGGDLFDKVEIDSEEEEGDDGVFAVGDGDSGVFLDATLGKGYVGFKERKGHNTLNFASLEQAEAAKKKKKTLSKKK